MMRIAPCLLAAATVCACSAPPVESPRTTVVEERRAVVDQNLRNKVDILFMIDNSSSMDPMQLELRQRFGDFLQVFADLAARGTYADLHIGVVTSDYGAGDVAGGGCDASPGGQRGLLQTVPSPNAVDPPPGCAAPIGAPYIAYAFDANGGAARTNLPSGNDAAALVGEFTCMASVGARGCGFEHPLESVYQALHNTKENAGFLRPDALLVVVFVTNEDDGSAPPTAKFYEATSDPAGTSAFGQYATYRQTRFGVECGGAPIPYGMPLGPLAGCAAAPNPTYDPGREFDVDRYVNFFTQPAARGGVKVNPEDVILVGIDGPEAPFSTVLVDPTQGPTPYHDCAAPLLSSSCVEALQHSCENRVQPGFFADPAVRLNQVLRAARTFEIDSICGDDADAAPSFSRALTQAAAKIVTRLEPACLGAPVLARADGTPDCVVTAVTDNPDGTTSEQMIPSCAENGGATPCWRLDDRLAQYRQEGCVAPPASSPPTCKLPSSCQPVVDPLDGTQQLGAVSIDRGGVPAPDNTYAHVSCATVASAM